MLAILLVLARRRRPVNWTDILAAMERETNQGGKLKKPREIARRALRLLPGKLGQGNFASVSKGMLQESTALPSILVAVKVCADLDGI